MQTQNHGEILNNVASEYYIGILFFRLVAIRYLQSTLANNIHHAFRILPKAIEDTDYEVRRIMVDMCSSLLVVDEYAADTVKELQEWTEVRRLTLD